MAWGEVLPDIIGIKEQFSAIKRLAPWEQIMTDLWLYGSLHQENRCGTGIPDTLIINFTDIILR